MLCSAAIPSSDGGAQGGVGLVIRERPNGWGIESTCLHGLNVVSFYVVTSHTRTPLIRMYLTPSILEHLPYFKEELQSFKGLEPIGVGDLNVDLDESRIL